jgi:hypothetical protein
VEPNSKTRFGFGLLWRPGGLPPGTLLVDLSFIGSNFYIFLNKIIHCFSSNHNKVTTNCPQTNKVIEKWWYFFQVKNQFSSLFVKHHGVYDNLFLFLFPKCKKSPLKNAMCSWMWSITWCEMCFKLHVWINLSIMACQEIL